MGTEPGSPAPTGEMQCSVALLEQGRSMFTYHVRERPARHVDATLFRSHDLSGYLYSFLLRGHILAN